MHSVVAVLTLGAAEPLRDLISELPVEIVWRVKLETAVLASRSS